MLDTHTHILPKMDDGSANSGQSMAMLLAESEQGIDKVVLTPHFYGHTESMEMFLKRRAASLARLEESIAGKSGLPRRYIGAEVSYFPGVSRIEELGRLCIQDTNALLVEMPFCRWDGNVLEELDYLLKNRGIRPIIAHVERYIDFQPSGVLRNLCEDGVWIQANAQFFTDWRTGWKAKRLLKKGFIHFIGSDCHNMDRRRPDMGSAISKLDAHALDHLEEMEFRLLEGE